MANSATLSTKDYIEVIYDGDQSYDTVAPMMSQAKMLSEELKSMGKPVLAIVNLEKMGKSTPGSREATVEALKNFDYERVAIFGATIFLKHLANLFAAAVGKEDRIRSFKTKEEAEEWLMKK